MSRSRFISLAVALASASTLIACTTAPAMPMGAVPADSVAGPERMAAMDAQMKMADHMKAMQGGMGIPAQP